MENEFVCTHCGHVGATKTITRGSIVIEAILWLCFLIPGIIYSVWRHTSRFEACPSCNTTNLLPAKSPLGQKFIKENFPERLIKQTEVARPPSKVALSFGRSLGRLVGKLRKT